MPVPVIVLNFGHSVLRNLDDYTEAASEIYRHYRQGKNVVAVTSAQGDETDVLMAEARRIGPDGDAKNMAELLQLGERRSAARLALALERIGAPAFVRQARDLGLRAHGPRMDAELVSLNVDQLRADLKEHDVVVMPGYVAIGEKDRPALLGNGGADLSALYVADRLGVEAILLKDVDGIYTHDPKQGAAKRYTDLSWDEAKSVAGPLIAPKALDFAAVNKVPFRVGQPGMPVFTRVGAASKAAGEKPAVKKLRVAMMGLGVVGGGVFRRIEANSDRFEMVSMMVRNKDKYIDQGYPEKLLTTDFDEVLAATPDVFVDVSGPIDPALGFCERAVKAGIHVVSANKQAIAKGGQALIDLAAESKAQLLFSSAAGGGMPILEMCLRERGRIARIEGLLNGTTNYMLGEISKGRSYADALKDAQDKGFAEADPSGDVNGSDAGAKIRLLALLGYGEAVDLADIPMDTIENFSPSAPPKGAVKRVATCWFDKDGFGSKLELKDLPLDDFIAQADGEEAHAVFTFTDGEQYKIRGKGAGRWPTSAAVMADLYDISASYITL